MNLKQVRVWSVTIRKGAYSNIIWDFRPLTEAVFIRGLKILLVLVFLAVQPLSIARAGEMPKLSLTLEKAHYTGSENFSVTGMIITTDSRYARKANLTIAIMPALKRGAPIFGLPWVAQEPLAEESWQRELPIGLTTVELERHLEGLELPDGVYPLDFTAELSNGLSFSTRAFLVILRPDTKRLPVAVMWSFYPGEHRLPDGSFLEDLSSLVQAAPSGRGPLQRHLDAIESNPEMKVNIAAGPTLVEQLTAMSGGYIVSGPDPFEVSKDSSAAQDSAAWLSRFNKLVEAGQIESLTAPYGEAPLALLAAAGWEEDIRGQIALAAPPETDQAGFFLPGLTLDSFTARRLAEAEFAYTVILEGESDSTQSPRVPLKFDHAPNHLTIFSADPELASWVASVAPGQADNQLTAILAQRYLEAEDDELVVVTSSRNTPPSSELAGRIYQTISTLSWIESVPLSKRSTSAVNTARVRPADNARRPLGAAFDSLSEARQLWVDFAQSVPAKNSTKQRLDRYLFRAESLNSIMDATPRNGSVGELYADAVANTIRSELAKVRLAPPKNITFSTKRGKVPVAIYNGAGYPIRAQLELSGRDFSFPNKSQQSITLKPKENLITYDIIAGFTGLKILDIRVAVGEIEIANEGVEVSVSSMLRYLVVGGSIFVVLGLGVVVAMRGRKE